MRGKFMREAVPEGVLASMSAIIGLDDASVLLQKPVKNLPRRAGCFARLTFNSPGREWIAGHKEAVKRAGAACKAAGAKRALPLPVSVPSLR